MNSPYTRHLDAPGHAPMPPAAPANYYPPVAHYPAYPPPPPQGYYGAPVGRTPGWVTGLLAGLVAFGALYLFLAASGNGLPGARPSWQEMKRYEELSRREGESDGKKTGKEDGIKQGREEMAYRVQYERLVNQTSAFNAGWQQGMGTGKMIGNANYRARYGGWNSPWGSPYYGNGRRNGSGYGYGGYYRGTGGRTSSAIGQAQQLANATGQPVDVIID